METNSDRFDTKKAILATAAESQQVLDFLGQQMEYEEILEALDIFFEDSNEDLREDFHLD